MTEVPMHPKSGASWEGFALEEIIRAYEISAENCYFLSSTGEAELDLLFTYQRQKIGFEIKHTDSPKVTSSMKKALHDLKLDKLILIVPGTPYYQTDDKIYVCGLSALQKLEL